VTGGVELDVDRVRDVARGELVAVVGVDDPSSGAGVRRNAGKRSPGCTWGPGNMIIVRVLLAHVPVAYHRGVLRGAKRRNLEGGVAGYAQNKDDYLKRLRRIEGQVRGLQRMIEEDQYCIDILTQVAAATKALQSVAIGLLEEHLGHCVTEAVAEGGDTASAKVREASEAIARLVRS